MKPFACLLLFAFASTGAIASDSLTALEVTEDATVKANLFLATLNDQQVEGAVYAFTDEKQRHNWSNLPIRMAPRGGLRWGDLNQKQKDALASALKAALSEQGYQQIVDNMEGDEFLKVNGRQRPNQAPMFGRDEYYVSFLGKPSMSEPWMLQFGGHHLAFNITVVGNSMTISPSLTGGQPIDFTVDGRVVRQLSEEEDKSFELIESFTPDQLKQTLLGDRYTNMRYGPGEEGAEPKEEGINAAALQPNQQKLLLQLIGERMSLMKQPFAKARMSQIKSDLGKTWLSWYGEMKKGGAATFRIQGPTILMEYSPQRLGGDPTNHIHAMYRDPTNDYGVKLVKEAK